MPVIHFPNLRFEEELAGPLETRPAKLEQLTAELAVLLGLQAAPGDVVLVEAGGVPDAAGLPTCLSQARYLTFEQLREELGCTADEQPSAEWQLAPWGWSDAARRLLRSLRLQQIAPDGDAVRRVNTRAFAADFDVLVDPDTGTPAGAFSRLCDSAAEVTAAIAEFRNTLSERWVIKANLSHAARNRLLGMGADLSPDQQRWLARRLQAGEPVCVEPWVRRLRECGLQWTVSAEAGQVRAEFDGAAEMLTDGVGQYRGSLIGGEGSGESSWWQAAVESGRRVALAAGGMGFRGPLGIDCMLIESGGRQWLRTAHDINGRQTMGRLALSLERLLPEGFCGAWCHIPAKFAAIESDFSCNTPDFGVSAHRTSPLRTGGRPLTLQTLLLIGNNSTLVTAAALQLTNAVVPVQKLPDPPPG